MLGAIWWGWAPPYIKIFNRRVGRAPPNTLISAAKWEEGSITFG
jgi:hypothetical protein